MEIKVRDRISSLSVNVIHAILSGRGLTFTVEVCRSPLTQRDIDNEIMQPLPCLIVAAFPHAVLQQRVAKSAVFFIKR